MKTEIDWERGDTLLLDMDGVLLDLHFDNHFWHRYLPRRYGRRHGLSTATARAELERRYAAVRDQLDWYCVEYWSRELDMDVLGMKRHLRRRIKLRPGARRFLAALKQRGVRHHLLSDAHPTVIALKLEQLGLAHQFDSIHSSHDIGSPKQTAAFWSGLADQLTFEADRSVLIDDTEAVLDAAADVGIGQLFTVRRPDSAKPRRRHSRFPMLGRLAPPPSRTLTPPSAP